MNFSLPSRSEEAKVAPRAYRRSPLKQFGLASKSTSTDRSKQHAQRMARTASASLSISRQTDNASTKKALPASIPAPENHYLLKSSLIDTVRVVVDARGVLLSELTEANPRVKRDGFKYVVSFPQHGTTATLLQFGKGENLHIEFSAPKLLTGQNIIGIHDLHSLCVSCIKRVFTAIGFPCAIGFKQRIERGGYRLSRVDVTGHIACGTGLRATALMRSIWQMLASQPDAMKEVSAYGLETFYAGQHSRYATLKVYRKDLELFKHPLPASVFAREKLAERAVGLVRIEYTLRSPCLQQLELDDPLAWKSATFKELLQPWVDRLQRTNGAVPDVVLMDDLPKHLQQKLAAWLHGDKIAFVRGVNADTARENRNAVLKTTGIDVGCDLTPDEQKQCLLTLREMVQRGFALKSNDQVWPKFLAVAESGATKPVQPHKPAKHRRTASAQGIKRRIVR
jgi:Phage replication protein CRI